MRKTIKSILVILLLCVTVVSSPAATMQADAVSVTDKQVYWTTGYGSGGYCTLSANIYMIRRAMIARGSTKWANVTYKSAGPALCTSIPGMKWHYTYTCDGVTVKGEHLALTGTPAQKAAKLRKMLDAHPEGVVVRGNALAGYSHGALLTGYYGTGLNQFWVADSTHNASKFVSSPRGIETWASSTLNTVGNVQDVWYLKSVSGIAYSCKNRFLTLDGKTYYYDGNNKRAYGWKEIGNNTYFFDRTDGAMVYGYNIIDGEPVYLDEKTGALSQANGNGVQYCFGSSRYDTSLKAADAVKYELGKDKFETIVVASGANYPDALSGGCLAAKNEAPMLLVGSGYESKVAKYINNNLADGGKVYILGGTGAVSTKFEKLITSENVVRLAGASRYETNLAILKEIGGNQDEVFVCKGTSYADSLSASAVENPILLVGTSLTAEQKAYLKNNAESVTIIGGTSAISTGIENEIKALFKPAVEPEDSAVAPADITAEQEEDVNAEINAEPAEKTTEESINTADEISNVKRISGKTRYATSAAIAEKYFGGQRVNPILVYGQNFPDGLSGGPLAVVTGRPIILATSKDTAAAKEAAKTLKAYEVLVLGGPKLISRTAAESIVAQ